MTYDEAVAVLETNGQSHVLNHWSRLDESERENLLAQVEALDFDNLAHMKELLAADDEGADAPDIRPASVVEVEDGRQADAVARGEQALGAGEVGVILVAGGQGSRLGFDGPKGSFPLGPLTNASLFEIHSRKILALERKYNSELPLYIMTSRVNDGATREFFAQNGYFGLSRDRVMFFVQGMWPALLKDGSIILQEQDRIFMSPDGHGGTLTALRDRGMLEDMRKRGITTLFYFQVDNPLVEIADPLFVGRHILADAEMSVKVCAKRDPEEGLGVVVEDRGHNRVVEYTELTSEQKHEALEDGKLKFRFGSVAIHVFSREFLEREADAGMPLHIAHKKVPYCDDEGTTVRPESPNAYKFEKFIFDALPDARKSLNVAFAREEEFSPVKNASGADSAATARKDMMLKWARWFEQCGVKVTRDENGDPAYKIEIDPCYANSADDLKEKLAAGFEIDGDTLLR